jgi:hypothetical protein
MISGLLKTYIHFFSVISSVKSSVLVLLYLTVGGADIFYPSKVMLSFFVIFAGRIDFAN